MSAEVLELRSGEPSPPRREAKVFVRAIVAPAGAPWEQARAADLDARLGAPLPLSEVFYQVRRTEGWALGRPARFAAFYVRCAEAAGGLQTEVVVDGRPVRVSFHSPGERARRARRTLMFGGAAVATALLLGVMLSQALAARAESAAAIAALEQRVAAKQADISARERLLEDAAALARASAGARAMDDFLGDLVWASAAKAPEARIQALYWDRGYVAVEARGDASPFTAANRPVTRSDKPVRKGVWLWGVTAPRPAGAVAAATARAVTSEEVAR